MIERVAYFDHGSTAPLRESVLAAMKPFQDVSYGNASSPYSLGREARAALDQARDRSAFALGVDSEEIIFTSGGTESIIYAVIGAFTGNRHRGNHIITTTFEHPAVHAVFDFLKNEMGVQTEMVGVDSDGMVRLDELQEKLRDETVLVSVMKVNNEIGTIQDLNTVVNICESKGVLVHSDCVQVIGKIPINLADMGVDLASVSGHKFGGPKGVGLLYIRKGTNLTSLCKGSHEFGIRSGTENVAGIAGLSAALVEAVNELPDIERRLSGYRERIWRCICDVAPDAVYNGSQENCVPATMNVRLPGCEGEMLVLALDRVGVAVSTGSACHSGSTEPSHVLSAMGISALDTLTALRISMGYSTDEYDLARFEQVFPGVYRQIKKASSIE